jgi:formate hydrogenlyase subunit 4
MIHEVMVLDHSGPDFAFILYTSGLKLWMFGALVLGIVLPFSAGNPWLNLAMALGGMFLLAVVIGVIESVMARLRLLVVPRLLMGAGAVATVALILTLR